MNKDIFFDKNDDETRRFYYSTKGAYTSMVDILQKEELELARLLESKYLDKNEIREIKERIKRMKVKIETIEDLYKWAFEQS